MSQSPRAGLEMRAYLQGTLTSQDRTIMNCLKTTSLFAICVGWLSACAGSTPSHLPNPVLLPVYGIGSAIENAGYNARRKKVSDHVSAHHATLVREINAGGGPDLSRAMDLARVPASDRAELRVRLRQDLALYQTVEPLVVAFMVHGR